MPKVKAKKRLYTEENLINAVAAVKNKTHTYREASELFNVPLATICDKVKERVPLLLGKPGKYKYIPVAQLPLEGWSEINSLNLPSILRHI